MYVTVSAEARTPHCLNHRDSSHPHLRRNEKIPHGWRVLWLLSTSGPFSNGAAEPLGSIPTELGNFTTLKQFTVAGTSLVTGCIPTEVGLLTDLTEL